MVLKFHVLFLFTITAFAFIVVQASGKYCNRTCGKVNVPYPFGFSSGCQIQLNCSPDGEVLVDEFPVRSIGQETIKLSLEMKCGRPLDILQHLFTRNYAPTSKNALLMLNCSTISMCFIPGITAETVFRSLNCNIDSSCFSKETDGGYLDYPIMKNTQYCKYLSSSIFVQLSNSTSSGMSLEFQVMELRWWLGGDCEDCSKYADCLKFSTPSGQGYRCQCGAGLVGDGYLASKGCHRVNNINWRWKGIIGITSGGTAILILCVVFWISLGRISSNTTFNFWQTKGHNKDLEAFIREYGPLSVRRYSYLDVKKMTNFFKDKLGQGGYGSVYKGKLLDGSFVAVKVLKESNRNGQEFINEVASIGRTSHVNVVTLLGFCLEHQVRALIYEFMPNGSLEKFITADAHLGWNKLYEIAVGVATGLEYLHRGCNTRIVHFDIKPQNILLDEDLRPKISDFGLAKLCSRKESILEMSEARGTIGYIAPEVFSRNFGEVSHKSDVYSYGMLVLEIVGERNKDGVEADCSSEEYFPQWVYRHLEQGSRFELPGETSIEEVETARKMALIGLWCIQTNPVDRPSMSRVIDMLEGSLEALKIPPKPFMSAQKTSPSYDYSTASITT